MLKPDGHFVCCNQTAILYVGTRRPFCMLEPDGHFAYWNQTVILYVGTRRPFCMLDTDGHFAYWNQTVILYVGTRRPFCMLEPDGHFVHKLRFCSITPTAKNPREYICGCLVCSCTPIMCLNSNTSITKLVCLKGFHFFTFLSKMGIYTSDQKETELFK
jgi:hypothetical protein